MLKKHILSKYADIFKVNSILKSSNPDEMLKIDSIREIRAIENSDPDGFAFMEKISIENNDSNEHYVN